MKKFFVGLLAIAFFVVSTSADARMRRGDRFDMMDMDGDGELNDDEIIIRIQLRFNTIDTDNSGGITKVEIKTFIRSTGPDIIMPRMRFKFRRMNHMGSNFPED